MSPDEYVVKYKHQFWGIMLDVSRTGATGSIRAKLEDLAMAKIEAALKALVVEAQADRNGKSPIVDVKKL